MDRQEEPRATIFKVHIDGIQRTKDDILQDRVQGIFETSYTKELWSKTLEARNRLLNIGCFSEVSVLIDSVKGGAPTDYEVTFKVKELNRIRSAFNTLFGNQEASLQAGVMMPNIFGRGEAFKMDISKGTRETSTLNINLSKPICHDGSISSSLFQQMLQWPTSGFKELNRGVGIDATFKVLPQVVWNLSWEGIWRQLHCLDRRCPMDVRLYSGHSLKSSVKHTLTVDRRDENIFPTEGTYLRLQQEFAGLGGDIGFFKNEVECQANFPAGSWVFQFAFNGGILKETASSKKYCTLADKFYLGGPLNLRGFSTRGAGPSSEGYFTGGDVFASAGAHLYTPLPFVSRKGFAEYFRCHGFFTAGSIAQGFTDTDDLIKKIRSSVGIGLAFKLGGMAKIELNYCFPLSYSASDVCYRGFQCGIGVNFL